MIRFARAMALAAVMLLAGSRAQADTVVLLDGTRLSGEVEVEGKNVVIRLQDGTLTLPARRVAEVDRGEPASEPVEEPEAETPAPETAESGPRQLRKQQDRPPTVADVLRQKASVDFEGVRLVDVLTYIREVTGVNMGLSADVSTDADLVYLHVKDVTVKTILELVLEPRGFGYAIKPGQILYVRRGLTAGDLEVRVYDVKDLLVGTEDRYSQASGRGTSAGAGRGGGTGVGGGAGGGRGGGAAPQFPAPGAGMGVQFGMVGVGPRVAGGGMGVAGRGGRGGRGAVSSVTDRSGQLILLIKGSCGEGTWMDPASSGLISVGGGGTALSPGAPGQRAGF